MARDYARRRSAPPPAQVPGWVFMVVGLLIGVVVTGIFFTKGSKESKEVTAFVQQTLPKTAPEPKPAPAPAAAPAKAAEAKPEPKAEPKAPEKKPEDAKLDYSFYKVLPEQEVPVTEESITHAKPADKPKPDQAKPDQPKPDPQKADAQQLPSGKYILQVGSYPTAKDAEEQKAMLAMTIGETATVQTVSVDGKPAWHRVRLGPYSDQKALDKVRQKLQGNGVKYVLLKEKP